MKIGSNELVAGKSERTAQLPGAVWVRSAMNTFPRAPLIRSSFNAGVDSPPYFKSYVVTFGEMFGSNARTPIISSSLCNAMRRFCDSVDIPGYIIPLMTSLREAMTFPKCALLLVFIGALCRTSQAPMSQL